MLEQFAEGNRAARHLTTSLGDRGRGRASPRRARARRAVARLGALDAFTRIRLQDALRDIWLDRRTTTLLVTHDVDEAIALGQRAVIVTPRPARIQRTLEIDLPYPRDRGSAQFADYRRAVPVEFGISHAVAMASAR